LDDDAARNAERWKKMPMMASLSGGWRGEARRYGAAGFHAVW